MTDPWVNVDIHPIEWERRTEEVAKYIPRGSHIVEIGAGRQHLKDCCPQALSYFATEYVLGDPEVHQPVPRGTIVVAIGVMEYVKDLRLASMQMSLIAPRAIMTFCPTLSEQKEARRKAKVGWRNYLTLNQFLYAFDVGGYWEKVYAMGEWMDHQIIWARRS